MAEMNLFEQFRQKVYGCLRRRAHAWLDLIDSLTVAGQVESPVALSEEIPFRRQHSSIPDALNHGQLDLAELGQVLYELQPAEAETMAGYEVYAVDTTPEERPEAATLADGGQLKSQKDAPVGLGHKYSWLARLVTWQTSWVAPLDVQRVATASSDSGVAADQVKALDQRSHFEVVCQGVYKPHVECRLASVSGDLEHVVNSRIDMLSPQGFRPFDKRFYELLLPVACRSGNDNGFATGKLGLCEL